MSSKFRIGSIARCIGMKGEVVVNPDTFDINRFYDLDSVYVGHSEDASKQLSIESVRLHKERPVLKFSSADSRNDAEQLVGKRVYVDENERIELPEGRLFIHDIIGMKVYTVDKSFVGHVKDVLQLPAHNIYVVSHDDKEVLIPAVDEFIDSIDEDERTIRIKPIEGLLE